MRTRQDGYTLLEVLVSITLLTLIIGGGIATLMQGRRMIEDARDLTRVSQIVQSEIEALRTMNWSDLQAMPWYYQKLPLTGSFAAEFGDRYSLYRSVHSYSGTQKGIYIDVFWRDSTGYLRRQRHYTRVTQGGLNDYFYRAF